MLKINEKLKEIREKSGFTQQQIAAYLDVDQSYISKWEKGERQISIDVVEKMANLFGYHVDYFLNDNISSEPITFALRAGKISPDDMTAIAVMNKLVLNIRFMSKLLKEA